MNDQQTVSDVQETVNETNPQLGRFAALRANPEVRKLAKTAATTALTMAVGVVVKAGVEALMSSIKEQITGGDDVYESEPEALSDIEDVTAQIAALAKENESK